MASRSVRARGGPLVRQMAYGPRARRLMSSKPIRRHRRWPAKPCRPYKKGRGRSTGLAEARGSALFDGPPAAHDPGPQRAPAPRGPPGWPRLGVHLRRAHPRHWPVDHAPGGAAQGISAAAEGRGKATALASRVGSALAGSRSGRSRAPGPPRGARARQRPLAAGSPEHSRAQRGTPLGALAAAQLQPTAPHHRAPLAGVTAACHTPSALSTAGPAQKGLASQPVLLPNPEAASPLTETVAEKTGKASRGLNRRRVYRSYPAPTQPRFESTCR